MRRKKRQFLTLCGLVLAAAFAGCNPGRPDNTADERLNRVLEQKDYFKLEELLSRYEDELTEDRRLYYKTFVTKAFGERDQSTGHINVLLERYRDKFNDTVVVKLLDLKAANFIYNYKYREAAEIYERILNEYAGILDTVDIAGYQNARGLFGTFSDVEPQVVHQRKSVTVASYRNQFNHLMTPVTAGGISKEFIFDTGANLSAIAESQAREMNLTMFEQNVDVGSSTQIMVQSKLAVADSLYVGDILFEHVVFLVMPDEQLTFPEIGYEIHGIIGFPVIHQLGEVHLNKDGSMTIPGSPEERKLKNMVLEGLNPVVRAVSDDDTLLFTFDTGASHSELSYKYFNDHKSEVETAGELQSNQRAGAGGNALVKEYMLRDFPINIGMKRATLPTIPVTLEEYSFNEYFDGNLGQDVFTQFNSLIINFRYMYIDFE